MTDLSYDKEETSRTIFGVGRADCSVLKLFTQEQEMAILETLELIDAIDTIYDQQEGATSLGTAFSQAKEKFGQILPVLPEEDLKTKLLAATLKAYEDWITLTIGSLSKLINETSFQIAIKYVRAPNYP